VQVKPVWAGGNSWPTTSLPHNMILAGTRQPGSTTEEPPLVFTGLVEALGRVQNVNDEHDGRRFTIVWPDLSSLDPWKLGESISVSGCCLTLIEAVGQEFVVQAGPETLERTNLSDRKPGDPVNLERSLKVGDRLGGHFVQGHVDTTAILRERRRQGDWEFLEFDISPSWTKLMVPKGSIALDGISLTLVEVRNDGFSVMLIPHTLAMTTLGTSARGDRVNIEVDILAKHVRKLLGL
jgi:riboflavin synthase